MVSDRIHPQTPGAMLHPGAGGAGTLAFPLSPGSVACDGGSLVKEGVYKAQWRSSSEALRLWILEMF